MSNILGDHTGNIFLSQLTILPVVLNIAMVVCAISLVFCLIRMLLGPSLTDRAVSLDSCGIVVMCLIIIYSIKQGTNLYMSAVLVISILGFIGAVSLSKYIQSGNIVDNKDILKTAGSAIDGRYDPEHRHQRIDRHELRQETKQQVKEIVENLNQDLKKDLKKVHQEKHKHQEGE